ncbi:MAG: hypothetical protein BWY65_00369 [Firmicutes bacterium ADurb.Bin373]|nr:MAG: hypothetical protein BWY65_00369 [Firmicutes bacterium ADurb.Bin373]
MTEPIDPKEIVNVEPETGDIIIRLKRGYPLTPEGFEKLYADHLALCDTFNKTRRRDFSAEVGEYLLKCIQAWRAHPSNAGAEREDVLEGLRITNSQF